jgi:uncharacterized protein (TIGR02266 family)
MTELRRYKRKPIDVDFRGGEESGAGQLLFGGGDVSAGGAFLRSDLLLERGERLNLELTLPGRARPIRAEAAVVWVRRFPKPGEEAGMGIEFLQISEADRRAIEEWVERP